jgi:hypothetical protein
VPDRFLDQKLLRNLLGAFSRSTQQLMTGLWLIRDNSINPAAAYLALDTPKARGLIFEPWGLSYQMATKDVQFTNYTPDEIRAAWNPSPKGVPVEAGT